jgi:hypothetical protein
MTTTDTLAARRALAAWDTTPLKTNADGRLCESMECLRAALEAQAEAKPAEPFVTSADNLTTQLRGYAVAVQDEQPYWADKIKAACDELEAQAEAKPANTLAEALREAAQSLETIARNAGKALDTDGQENYLRHFDQVRGYANSRATVARAALEAQAEAKPAEPSNPVTVYTNRGAAPAKPADADSYDSIWHALQKIDTAACAHPLFVVEKDGGIDAVTHNIVSLIHRTAAPAAPAPHPDTKDAERFRYMVSRILGPLPMVRVQVMRRGQYVLVERDLREAIDAAIAASKENTK